MMQQKSILEAFVKLGDFFTTYIAAKRDEKNAFTTWNVELNEIISKAKHHNGWFTEDNLLFAVQCWGELLIREKLTAWLSPYVIEENQPKTIAIIMAGNIPLVGFHDFLTVLCTGNSVLVKLAGNDTLLLPFIAKFLIHSSVELAGKIAFTEEKLEGFDAIIATGSNNTARYFEHYFGKYPNIIRKNRNSIAILTGTETEEQLSALGEDIFRYYGLGCRSVSKLFVPEGYDFDAFFKAIFPYSNIAESAKYHNNYEYNKAVYLMSGYKLLENGFLILKEDKSYASPIASLFYERYSSLDGLKKRLKADQDKIQCMVSDGIIEGEIPFGTTQKPGLAAYADGIDTVAFLLKTSQI